MAVTVQEVTYVMRSFLICTVRLTLYGKEIKEDGMGEIWGLTIGDQLYLRDFSWKTSSEETIGRPRGGWKNNIKMYLKINMT
jgi:hypothetical protein